MFGWTPTVPRPQDAGPRTAAAWPALHRARTHAARRGDRFVGTQHLLLALVSDGAGETRDVLAAAGVDLASVEAALAGIQGSGAPVAPVGPDGVGLSARASTVLARAAGDGGPVADRDVLAALICDDDPALARLTLHYIGALTRIRAALARSPSGQSC